MVFINLETECGMASQAVIEVSDAQFEQEVLKSDQPVLVDFWAIWCGPCKAIAPVVDQVATKFAGKAKIMKMDVDKNNAVPMRYGVRGIPTLLFFKDGKVAQQFVGANVSADQIEKVLTGLGA
jgi:thioredoxin 1